MGRKPFFGGFSALGRSSSHQFKPVTGRMPFLQGLDGILDGFEFLEELGLVDGEHERLIFLGVELKGNP